MLNFCSFQVNQYVAFQNSMIENQIYFKPTTANGNCILSAHKSKTFT